MGLINPFLPAYSEIEKVNYNIMNKKLQKFKALKKVALFGFMLVLTNCQVDDLGTKQLNDDIQTVSIDEAKKFLTRSKNSTSSKMSNINENLDLDKITQEKLNGSDQLLTVIPFKTNNKFQNDRVLLINEKNEIKSVVFSMYPDDKFDNSGFSGQIFIYSLDGNFINGYRAKDGIMIAQFVKMDKKASPTAKLGGELNEVVIPGRPKRADVVQYDMIYSNAGGQGMSWDTVGGITGGGGSNGANPPVADVNPCDKIKEQINNALFNSKKEELSKKTGAKGETGYSQSKNGPFTALNMSGTDALNIDITDDMIGFMHTHVDEYESNEVDPDGNIQIRKPIKMFSPADIGIFLGLVKNAKTNNVPIANVYGAMVSSSGVYELRFNGNPDNIESFNWKKLDEVYKTYFKNESLEIGFLKFLEENGNVSGIELYKINKNGTTTKKTLGTNKKVVEKDC